MGSSNGGVNGNATGRGVRKENRLASEMSDQQLFDLSDDESLFSSGYGMSLDMPSSDLVVGAVEFGNNSNSHMTNDKRRSRLEKTPSSETDFGFESVNKSEIENEMRKAEASFSEPTKVTLLRSLGLGRSKDLEVSRNFAESVASLSDQMTNGCNVSNDNTGRSEKTNDGKTQQNPGHAAFGDSAWTENGYK